MIFYESLEQLPDFDVQRDFSAENRLPDSRKTTYLHLAASRFSWDSLPVEVFQEIESFLLRGGRLVVTFLPENSRSFPFITTASKPTTPGKKTPKAKKADARLLGRTSLKERWGAEMGFVPLAHGEGLGYQPVKVQNQTDLALPAKLAWHSGMIFTNLSDSWRTIYARDTNAVVIERKFGAGLVIIASDSYFVSNEAMAKERHAELLAWLVGPTRHVVFDEGHLGIVESPGVTVLMRKYRLHGLAAGLLALAGLFIWKNSTSFLPLYAEEEGRDEVAGKEASAGLVNLLRRNIAPGDVLRVCFDEWTKSLLHGDSHSIARVDQAQTVLEAETGRAKVERDPVRAYQEICRVLKGRNP